jgi:hypothetical protein
MAVPTITSITPEQGLTRGRNLVKIYGTNFQMPPDPPLNTSGPAFQSIKVMFGALQSQSAFAITPTFAVAEVPTYEADDMDGDGVPVDLTLYNLDSAGVEIPGEMVVHSSYTYGRPLFTDEQVLEYVMTHFVKYLRRHVTDNIWITMGRSYSEGDDQINEQIKQAKHPLIWINGIDLESNPLAQRMKDREFLTTPTDFDEYRVGTAVNVVMSNIQIYSSEEHSREIIALQNAVTNALRDVPHLKCAPPSFDTEATEYKYPMVIPAESFPSFDLGPENDGLKTCSLGITIQEVDLTDLAGTLTDIGWTVEEDPEIDFSATQ